MIATMGFLILILTLLLFVVLFMLLVCWAKKCSDKRKEEFLEEVIDNVSDKLSMVWNKVGPWYLVVCTQESNRPIWISNNNIRSIHPDLKNRKIIIKQFNGEDMVIENVENYELCPANKMCDYDL